MAYLSEPAVAERYNTLGEQLQAQGMEIETVKEQVERFDIEVPSWLFGPFGGGRFGDYVPPAPAPDIKAKIQDAAQVHKLTGAAPRVAIHLGWDKPPGVAFEDIEADHFRELRQFAAAQGLELGTVSPTLFLEGTHHGSLSSPLEKVRENLIRHCITACKVAHEHCQGVVTYWLPDGSNYPGQVDLWEQEKRARDALKRIYTEAPETVTHLIEYKLFEPGTYSTVISGPGVAQDVAESLGARAGALVDIGHHAHGVNIAQIVSRLVRLGGPAGMHFNTRYAADDDHAVEPNVLIYSVLFELAKGGAVAGGEAAHRWSHVIDQCSSLENRIRAILHSIDSLQISLAKALTVDVASLKERQRSRDIIGANRVFLDAFLTDVRPILWKSRLERGLPLDPVEGYDRSGYQEKIAKERNGV